MKIAFLGFDQFYGRKDVGSSMIRCDWPIRYWQEAGPKMGTAERYRTGGSYDAIVFQKVYWPEFAEGWKGIKVLDVCDPDWLHWRGRVKQMADACDAITTSNETIAAYMRKITDRTVVCVPDRVDLKELHPMKDHKGDAEAAVWFGYAQNHPMLETILPAVRKAGLRLIIVSDRALVSRASEDMDIKNCPWTPKHWMRDVCSGDIVLNPRSEAAHWRYKSNNKTVQAWALGMPVASTGEEIMQLIPEKARVLEAADKLKETKERYDVRSSIKEIKEVIFSIQTWKNKAIPARK